MKLPLKLAALLPYASLALGQTERTLPRTISLSLADNPASNCHHDSPSILSDDQYLRIWINELNRGTFYKYHVYRRVKFVRECNLPTVCRVHGQQWSNIRHRM